MERKILIVLLFLFVGSVCKMSAQNVGINSSGAAPHVSTILDLNTGNTFTSPNGKGLLVPNVALTSTSDAVTIGTPATSLLVYNTASISDVTPGYYYWSGTAWVRFLNAGAGAGSAWLTLGNASTVDGTNFIGTTDNIPFNFRVNNQKAGRIASTGETFLGYQAGNSNTATDAAGFGYQALKANTTGTQNTAMGSNALPANISGYANTAFGTNALQNNTGNMNTGIGTNALRDNQGGDGRNVALGVNSVILNTTGVNNTGLGVSTITYNTTGSNNTVVGTEADLGVVGNSHSNNSILGYRSGYTLTTGSNNILFGYKAGDAITTGSNNIVIGYDVDAPVATSSNQMTIGNLIYGTGINGTGTTVSTGNIGIGLNNPTAKLEVTQPTAGSIGARINLPTGVEATASGVRVTGYSPAYELLDKDNVMNWYMGIDDNDNNKFLIGRGYGPGQSINQVITLDPATDYMGVGATAPYSKLHVKQTGPSVTLQGSGGNDNIDVQFYKSTDASGTYKWDLSYRGAISSDDLYLFNDPLSATPAMAWQRATGNASIGVAPNTKAKLEIASTTSGLLIPRMTNAQRTAIAPGAAANLGLLIYQTDIGATAPIGIGFYYWDGTVWVSVASGSGASNNTAWTITGNGGTTSPTLDYNSTVSNNGSTANNNFIGTTDAKDLAFVTKNFERMRITSAGNVGIGTFAPLALAALTIKGGNSNSGQNTFTGVVPGYAQIAFQYGGNLGYAHFIATRHDNGATAGGNAIDFFINSGVGGGAASTQPGVGNFNVMTIENYNGTPRVGVGTFVSGAALCTGPITANGSVNGMFEVHAASANSDITISTADASTANVGGLLEFRGTGRGGAGGNERLGQIENVYTSAVATDRSSRMTFYTNNGTTYKRAMDITSAQYLGVNEPTPLQRIEISGGLAGNAGNWNKGIPATSGTTQNGLVRITPGNEGAGNFGEALDIGFNVAPTPGSYAWLQATNHADLSTHYPLNLNPNGGNVGIGTKTPAAVLEIASNDNSSTNNLIYFDNDPANGSADIAAFKYEPSGSNPFILDLNPQGDYNRPFSMMGGNIGIGTYDPQYPFHIQGSSGGFNYFVQTIEDLDGGDPWIVFKNGGGVGSTAFFGLRGHQATVQSEPGYPVRIETGGGGYGDIEANDFYCQAYGGWLGATVFSDIRYKKDIKPLTNSLENILKLQGVNYFWKKDEFPGKHFNDREQIGFIAQEMEKIYPDLVNTDDKGYKSIEYAKLTPVLVEALKELAEKNAKLEASVVEQQKKIDTLQKETSSIEDLKKEMMWMKANMVIKTDVSAQNH